MHKYFNLIHINKHKFLTLNIPPVQPKNKKYKNKNHANQHTTMHTYYIYILSTNYVSYEGLGQQAKPATNTRRIRTRRRRWRRRPAGRICRKRYILYSIEHVSFLGSRLGRRPRRRRRQKRATRP